MFFDFRRTPPQRKSDPDTTCRLTQNAGLTATELRRITGLLLSAFPILAVFAAFADRPLLQRFRGKIAVGAVALLASLALTAVYHAGYSDFRSSKLSKPITGDPIWSIPTLVTLNPIGAPIAHVGLHVSAVLHSYNTDTFLPPHK